MMVITVEEKIANFWHRPDAASGASAEELNAAERRLGFTLPPEFRTLLQARDGGIPRFDLFDDIQIAPFRGVANKAKTGHMVELFLKGGVESLPSGVVIFAADADSWFGFDYRAHQCPSVLHWSEYEDEPVQLAGTFREFLEGLSREE